MSSTTVSVRNATKVFESSRGTVHSLHDVSLDVAQGDFVTLVGPSGCGKSTMLNLIGGLLEPTSGQVLVDGKPVKGPGPDRGVIFQQYALFPWLTAEQNVGFGLRLMGLSKKEQRERAQHYLDLVGLGAFAKALPKELSGGMKQRCAIARAYAVNPSILLMDEPFGALDALTRVGMQDELLATWEKERRTIMFITHDVDEAVYLANRVVVMSPRPGRISDIVDVPLPYPRTEEMRLSDDFAHIRARVWRGVHQRDHEDQDPGAAQALATSPASSHATSPTGPTTPTTSNGAL